MQGAVPYPNLCVCAGLHPPHLPGPGGGVRGGGHQQGAEMGGTSPPPLATPGALATLLWLRGHFADGHTWIRADHEAV